MTYESWVDVGVQPAPVQPSGPLLAAMRNASGSDALGRERALVYLSLSLGLTVLLRQRKIWSLGQSIPDFQLFVLHGLSQNHAFNHFSITSTRSSNF